MTSRPGDPGGIDPRDEPHFRRRVVPPDESNRLDEEPARATDVPASCTDESVVDEPAMRWRPLDRRAIPGFAEHAAARAAATPTHVRILVVLGLALVTGPFAILGALLDGFAGQGKGALLAVVVFGPVAEEMLKISGILWLAERRPWLVPDGAWLLIAGAIGGLGFAAIENLMYLYVSLPDAGPDLARWRWTVCVAVHVLCSTIAAAGAAAIWRDFRRTGRPGAVARAMPWLVGAMIVHGTYNAAAVLMGMLGA